MYASNLLNGLTWLLSLLLQTARPSAPPKPQQLTAAQVPQALRLPGRLLEAWRWRDNRGENMLVAYRTVWNSADPEMSDARSAQLQIRQYVKQQQTYQELWRLKDGIYIACPVDLSLGLLPGSTSITDLDGNGETETTVVYRSACRGDVSPSAMKVILHAGKTKYALRGTMLILGTHPAAEAKRLAARSPCCAAPSGEASVEEITRLEGRYQDEKDFAGAPPAFLQFARQQWVKWRTHDDFTGQL